MRMPLLPALAGAAMLLAAAHAGAADRREVTIGLVDTFSPEFFIESISPTLDHLMAALPQYRFRLEDIGSEQAEADIRRLKPDFVISSSPLFTALNVSLGAEQVATRVPRESRAPDRSAASAVIVRAASPVQTLGQLRGRSAAVADRASSEGWLFALGRLAGDGHSPERFFSSVLETHYGFPDVETLVSSGAADAGIVPACEIETLEKRGALAPGALRVLGNLAAPGECARSTALYPGAVLSSMPGVDPALLTDITIAVLSMKNNPGDFRWQRAGDFRAAHELLQTLRIGPYKYLAEVSPGALWKRFRTEILLLAALIAAVLFHLASVHTLVRRRTRQLSHALETTKRLYEENHRTRQKFLELERSQIVSQLSSMFAHEVKQPIMAISLNCSALQMMLEKKGLLDARAQKLFEGIDGNITRTVDIVDHVRSYAKQRRTVKHPCDVRELAQQSASAFLGRKNFTLAPVPEGRILADAFEIEFILRNFIKNALTAVEHEKEPRVALSVAREGANWRFTCEDNGPALDDRAFASLGKVGQSSKPDGLGFGLAIATAIAERNGGHIEFRRRSPQGLAVSLVMPALDDSGQTHSNGGAA